MYETKEDRDRFYSSKEWRKKRLEILKRDHFECQQCNRIGALTSIDSTLIVDHIQELKDYPELKLSDDNLQTLCFYHHELKHGRAFVGNPKPNKWRGDEWY